MVNKPLKHQKNLNVDRNQTWYILSPIVIFGISLNFKSYVSPQTLYQWYVVDSPVISVDSLVILFSRLQAQASSLRVLLRSYKVILFFTFSKLVMLPCIKSQGFVKGSSLVSPLFFSGGNLPLCYPFFL